MIKLYTFPEAFGLRNVSPFCLKIEMALAYLDTKTDGGLFGDLSDEGRATGMAFTRLAEDHLYWIMVASRWIDDEWFENVKTGFFGALPPVIKTLVSIIARKQVKKTYELQGLGKHSLEEQAGFARRDFETLSLALKSGDYICGNRLTVYDFSVASLLGGIYDQKPPSWINPIADDFPELQDYAQRIQQEIGVYAAR